MMQPNVQRAAAAATRCPARFWLALALVAASAPISDAGEAWQFVDRTVEAGLTLDGQPVEHGFMNNPDHMLLRISGGVAAGDYDGDGWTDIYMIRGDIGPNLLFRNRGDGTFEEVGEAAGVAQGGISNGPLFADLDGDGWLDLIFGGLAPRAVSVYRNLGNGTFEDVTDTTGIQHFYATISIAAGDYDLDGDLDVYTSHWNAPAQNAGHLWRNNGDGTFTDADEMSNATNFTKNMDYTFTPNFCDVTNDGLPDLLIASDFSTSQIFHNIGQGQFAEAPLNVAVPDENGMGATLGDYDNDGDLDWFVTSIWDEDQVSEGNWGVTGNRMYRNRGQGTFEDATDEAGVREGDWGWGGSFADFNNDGWLDIVMVNGWNQEQFVDDPARLFVNRGDGGFDERGDELGVNDRGQGRGVACLDYDRDGDLDILIANNSGPLRLLRNESPSGTNFVSVRLVGNAPNTRAVGARVYVRTTQLTQMRELHAGCNYVSSNPVEAHFGLGSEDAIEELSIVWPDGRTEVHHGVPVNTQLTYYETTTPVTLSEFAAERVEQGVRVSWHLSGDAAATLRGVDLQRSASATGPFHSVAFFVHLSADMSHVDPEPGNMERWYRLVLEHADGSQSGSSALWLSSLNVPPRTELLWARAASNGAHIRYRVSGASTDVSLEIYDVRGRLIATPLRGRRAPGEWTHEWPARTADGRQLAHGLYFVRLRTPLQTRHVKLMLAPR